MSSKAKIAKEATEEVKSSRPVRNTKPVSYKEEPIKKKASNDVPPTRKKKINVDSEDTVAPPKKTGKKKPTPAENDDDEVSAAPPKKTGKKNTTQAANDDGSEASAPAPKKGANKKTVNEKTNNDDTSTQDNESKPASRKRKNEANPTDDVSAEKANGSKPTKKNERQKKVEEAVDDSDVDIADTVEQSEAPQPEPAEKVKKGRGKKTKDADVDDEEAVEQPEVKKGRGKKTKDTAETGATKAKKNAEKNDDGEVENGNSTSDKSLSKKAAAKAGSNKKKDKETVDSNAAEEENNEIVDDNQAASKPVASKSRGKKGSATVDAEDGEKKADDEKKASRQGKKVKEPATKATATKDSTEKASNGSRGVKRKLQPIAEEVDAPKLFKKSSSNGEVEPKKSKPKLNSINTDYTLIDFDLPPTKKWNMKIATWNVAGLRALIEKNGMEYVKHELPDILCLQETKCLAEEVPDHLPDIKYHKYWLAMKGGKAGVGLYSKVMPYNVEYGIGDKEMDSEGRVITAEFTKFYVVCVYVPNAGRKLVTLPKRLDWDKIFQEYLVKLDEKKPVIICGDLNVAHLEIDLANPKTNKKSAGFTTEERNGMTTMLERGFVDTFRHLYPDRTKAYTYWTYMANARAKNVGWRLDYFLISERLKSNVVDTVIRSEVMGSDHCPITLFLNF